MPVQYVCDCTYKIVNSDGSVCSPSSSPVNLCFNRSTLDKTLMWGSSRCSIVVNDDRRALMYLSVWKAETK